MKGKYHIEAINSQVALGSNITQIQENTSNVFNDLRKIIKENIKNENEKQYYMETIGQLENHKNDKKKFKEVYDQFIVKLGTYMSIFSPFLPLLAKYLPQ